MENGITLGQIALNVSQSLSGVAILGNAIAYISAFFFVIYGLITIKHNGVGNRPSYPLAFSMIGIGIVMMALPEFFGTGFTTIFGDSAVTVNPWP